MQPNIDTNYTQWLGRALALEGLGMRYEAGVWQWQGEVVQGIAVATRIQQRARFAGFMVPQGDAVHMGVRTYALVPSKNLQLALQLDQQGQLCGGDLLGASLITQKPP